MGSTPEAKIKKLVSKLLDQYEPLYRFWPVPSGFGASSLDCIVCYKGNFIAIETKAPGKKPTPRQQLYIDAMRAAYGAVFVVDSENALYNLELHLTWLRDKNADHS